MDPNNPDFLQWAARYGYAPWGLDRPHLLSKFQRYWLAWQAKVPPESETAHAIYKLAFRS